MAVDWDRLHQPFARKLPDRADDLHFPGAFSRRPTKHSVACEIGLPARSLRTAVLFSKPTSSTFEPLRLPSHSRSELSLVFHLCLASFNYARPRSSMMLNFVEAQEQSRLVTVAAVYDRRFFLATCHKTGGHRPPLQWDNCSPNTSADF